MVPSCADVKDNFQNLGYTKSAIPFCNFDKNDSVKSLGSVGATSVGSVDLVDLLRDPDEGGAF